MIKQWKVKQRVAPCAWTLPCFIMSLFSAYFCSFPYSSPFHKFFLFSCSYFEKKEGRER